MKEEMITGKDITPKDNASDSTNTSNITQDKDVLTGQADDRLIANVAAQPAKPINHEILTGAEINTKERKGTGSGKFSNIDITSSLLSDATNSEVFYNADVAIVKVGTSHSTEQAAFQRYYYDEFLISKLMKVKDALALPSNGFTDGFYSRLAAAHAKTKMSLANITIENMIIGSAGAADSTPLQLFQAALSISPSSLQSANFIGEYAI